MHTEEIEYKILKYRESVERKIDIEDEKRIEGFLAKVDDARDPGGKKPIPALEMAKDLDPTALIPLLKDSYKDFNRVKDRLVPRFRFFAYFLLKRRPTIIEAYRDLNDEDFRALGFKKRETYETLREFINERIGDQRFKEIFDGIMVQVVRSARERGWSIGERISTDATEIQAIKHDKDAKYSGYYKVRGYKVNLVLDMDDPSLILDYTPMDITADEGKTLPQTLRNLKRLGIHPRECKADTKYATYENIAICETSGTSLKYRIAEGWVVNPKGEEREVKRMYQKYHRDPDFVAGASTACMLKFLCKKKEYEVVGAYYRNIRMKENETHPDIIASEMGERSGKTEGAIAQCKLKGLLAFRLRRRGWNAFVRMCNLSMLASAFAALIRVQRGIRASLGNLTYIT